MDNNAKFVVEKRIERTIEALKANNMNGYYAKSQEELFEILESLSKSGDKVSVGGSMSLFEAGVMDWIKGQDFNYLDRYAEGLTKEDIKSIYREAFTCDVYFTSTNALTENGYLYNVDGNGNRVAAMIYGPDKVVVVAGANKIVKDEYEAEERNRETAAPANAHRLSRKTPCAKVGHCMDCSSPERICSDFVLIKKQMAKDRIHVIIMDEALGY